MKNLYTPSKLLSRKDFLRLEKVFFVYWSKDTTYSDVAGEWTTENKALGQCLITTLIVNDLYSGEMVYDRKNSHFWNILPDKTEQDFSRSQFKVNRIFTITKYKTRDEMLFDENGVKKHTFEKYQMLKDRFLKTLTNISE